MRHISPACAAAILTELRDNRDLATAPLQARAVWLNLVVAMAERRHTRFGLLNDSERLAEIAVGRLPDVWMDVCTLIQLGLLRSDADGYLRAPLLGRLGLT